jgi:hypothetical protein
MICRADQQTSSWLIRESCENMTYEGIGSIPVVASVRVTESMVAKVPCVCWRRPGMRKGIHAGIRTGKR